MGTKEACALCCCYLDDSGDVGRGGGEDDFVDGERCALTEEDGVGPDPAVPEVGEGALESEELRVPLEAVHARVFGGVGGR